MACLRKITDVVQLCSDAKDDFSQQSENAADTEKAYAILADVTMISVRLLNAAVPLSRVSENNLDLLIEISLTVIVNIREWTEALICVSLFSSLYSDKWAIKFMICLNQVSNLGPYPPQIGTLIN